MTKDARAKAAVETFDAVLYNTTGHTIHGIFTPHQYMSAMWQALAAADAIPGFVVVSTDDLRAVLDMADYWIDPASVTSAQLDPLDRLRAQLD